MIAGRCRFPGCNRGERASKQSDISIDDPIAVARTSAGIYVGAAAQVSNHALLGCQGRNFSAQPVIAAPGKAEPMVESGRGSGQ